MTGPVNSPEDERFNSSFDAALNDPAAAERLEADVSYFVANIGTDFQPRRIDVVRPRHTPETGFPFENVKRPLKSCTSKKRCVHTTHCCGRKIVLRHCRCGPVNGLHDRRNRGIDSRDCQGMGRLLMIEFQQFRRCGGCAEYLPGAVAMDCLARRVVDERHADAASHLIPGDDCSNQVAPCGARAVGKRECGSNHCRPGMPFQ